MASEISIAFFKQVVHINLNLAVLVLIAWLLTLRKPGPKTTLTIWSVVLLRFLLEPFLAPQIASTPLPDHTQPGSLSLGFGFNQSLQTLLLKLDVGGQILGAGELAVLALGESTASLLGAACIVLVAISLAGKLYFNRTTAVVGERFKEIHSGTEIWWCTDAVSPYLEGWMRPRIVLPAELRGQLSPQELTCVVEHELGHALRKDQFLYPLLFMLDNFSMVVWPLRPALREFELAVERVCDARAAEAVDEFTVATALVKIAGWQRRGTPCHAYFSGSVALLRLQSLRRSTSTESLLIRVVAVTLLGLSIL